MAVVAVALAVWQTLLLVAVLRGTSDALDVGTARVDNGPFVVGITREGKVASADVAMVRAPRIHSSLTLTWVIDDSSEVEEGDVVAKIDVSEYEFEVEQQRLNYQKARTRIDQERRERTRDYDSAEMEVEKGERSLDVLKESQRTELDKGEAQVGHDRWQLTWARGDFGRQSDLRGAGIVPQTAVDQSERIVRRSEHALTRSERDVTYMGAEHETERTQSEVDIDTSQFEAELAERRIGEAVRSAEEGAARTGRRLADMEEQLAAGELRAPRAGVVVLAKTWSDQGRRALREGDRMWSRMKVCEITNLEDLEVRVRVDEASASSLKVGQEAIITVEGASDREFQGEVATIGAVAHEVSPWEDSNAVPGQRVFDVTVKVRDPDVELIRPGVSVNTQFVAERVENAIYVPIKAIFDKPEGQIAYVKRGSRFTPRKVETGQRNDEEVIVLDGLKAGERVALSDPTRRETS